jgi:hypothetical protein
MARPPAWSRILYRLDHDRDCAELADYIDELEANAIGEVCADEVTEDMEWWCNGQWLPGGEKTHPTAVLKTAYVSDDEVAKEPVLTRGKQAPSPADKVLAIAAESGVDMTREQADAFAAYFAEQLS